MPAKGARSAAKQASAGHEARMICSAARRESAQGRAMQGDQREPKARNLVRFIATKSPLQALSRAQRGSEATAELARRQERVSPSHAREGGRGVGKPAAAVWPKTLGFTPSEGARGACKNTRRRTNQCSDRRLEARKIGGSGHDGEFEGLPPQTFKCAEPRTMPQAKTPYDRNAEP